MSGDPPIIEMASTAAAAAGGAGRGLPTLQGGERRWVIETGLGAETNRRAIWGPVNQQGKEASAARGSFPLLNRAFRIVERL